MKEDTWVARIRRNPVPASKSSGAKTSSGTDSPQFSSERVRDSLLMRSMSVHTGGTSSFGTLILHDMKRMLEIA